MARLLSLLLGLAALAFFGLGLVLALVSGTNAVVIAWIATVLASYGALRAVGRRGGCATCAAVGLGLVASIVANGIAFRPPTQASMEGWYRADPAAFDRLRERVAAGAGTTTEDEALLAAVGCRGTWPGPDGQVMVFCRSWGLANQGWRAGLAWSPRPHVPLLPTLDGFPSTRVPGHDRAYARIAGDWYAVIVW
jgi:hypothetical protein